MFALYFRWFMVIQFEYAYLSATSAEGSAGTLINLEGSVSEHDARIGSTINITCHQYYPKCLCVWLKDGRRLSELKKDGKRIEWIQAQKAIDKNERRCTAKVTIRNVTANDTGNYTCVSSPLLQRTSSNSERKSIFIYAVPCFQGYYCVTKVAKPKRCPKGTFSTNKNATSIQDCTPCPTDADKDEILSGLEPKTAARFLRNCRNPVVMDSRATRSLLTGELIAVWISVAVVFIVILMMAILRCWGSKTGREALIDVEDLSLEPPEEPPSKDVFICYSTKNKDWVRETLLVHLQEQDFQVVIDYIDFEAGIDISDNIINAIYNSRKTVFVLSEDSLKSYYARRELRQALAAGITGHQVIVVLYEKTKLPVETTHLGPVIFDWTKKDNKDNFWDGLYSEIRR